jgi:hypothetical protein
MIINCFPLSDKLDLMEARFDILWSRVDKFIVFDSQGNGPKLDKYKEKVVHVETQKFEENEIVGPLSRLSPNESDMIILSKENEIPNLEEANKITESIFENTAVSLVNVTFLNFFDMKCEELSHGSFAFFYNMLRLRKPQQLRSVINDLPKYLETKGWCLSDDSSLKAKKIDPEDYFPDRFLENKDQHKKLFST